jgi:hypothetical protein
MSIRTSLRASGVLAVIASTLSCAGTSDYVYTPDTANVTAAGLPAARTPIPQEKPQGAIEVASYGVTELRRDDMTLPALHVRVIITNDGDNQPWTLDTTQQLVEIPGEGRSRAIYVNSDVRTLPNVTIARQERRVLDMYFPLPDTMREESRLPRFSLLWQVNTAARTVASRTSFDRVTPEPEVRYAVAPAGWPLWAGYGPYWWYDPFYPRVVFVHHHPRVIRPGRVVVGRFDGRFRPSGSRPIVTERRRR